MSGLNHRELATLPAKIWLHYPLKRDTLVSPLFSMFIFILLLKLKQ